MPRYVLLEVSGDGGYDVIPHQCSAVRLVAEGSAAQCLLAAAEELRAAELHDIKLYQLPALHRRKGIAERKAGLRATAAEAAAAPRN